MRMWGEGEGEDVREEKQKEKACRGSTLCVVALICGSVYPGDLGVRRCLDSSPVAIRVSELSVPCQPGQPSPP